MVHARKSCDMSFPPSYKGPDRIILRYAYHKPFMDKCEWQKGLKLDIERGLVWYTDGSKTSNVNGAGVYRWGLRRG
jgi:hypothetical protein